MDTQNDRIKAMNFDYPEYIPIGLNMLPATWIRYREALDEVVARHPVLFGAQQGLHNYDEVHGTYVAGEHVDNWGCVWSNVAHGMEAIVTGHPLPTRASVRTMTPPAAVTGRLPHGLMYLRLGDLRGFEEIMTDFAEEPEELQLLLDTVLAHNLKELEVALAKHTEPVIGFGDDLGMQASLPISPAKWRKYLKPCFAALYGRCHEAGFSVYMHTDGHIYEIIPDLVECGVNIINPQIRANGLDNLARVCKGNVCVNLDLDRQMFPFCQPEEIDGHVREVVEMLGAPEGGLWITAECGPDVPLATIDALATALEKYRGFYRGAQKSEVSPDTLTTKPPLLGEKAWGEGLF
ncbi:MAG TPA: uroporphyrinogen decarboxylase family protein [Armatimonadota bacterium]|jgi:hypothetical protein